MIPQKTMIERLRRICVDDERVVGAMLYGSFAQQEADEFSDIDCALFFDDESLSQVNQLAWVKQIGPVDLYYCNEFGNGVAVFANLVRGEFHFDAASAIDTIETWRDAASFPSVEAALLFDRDGRLTKHLQALIDPPPVRDTTETVEFLCKSFLNWILFGSNVLARGERARALELLTLIHDYVLRMARISESCTRHWITPTKGLERELSEQAYARFAACTATVDEDSLKAAYVATWRWGNQLMRAVAQAHSVTLPAELLEKIDQHLSQHFMK